MDADNCQYKAKGDIEMEETSAVLNQETEQRPDSPQENVVKEARRHFSKFGLMFFFGTLITIAMQLITFKVVGKFEPEWAKNPHVNLAISLLPIWLVGIPALIFLLKKNVPAVQIEQHSMKFGHLLLGALMSYTLMYIGNIIGSILTFFANFFVGVFEGLTHGMLNGLPESNTAVNIFGGTSLWANLVFVVIGAPIIEEYVFRKLLTERTVRYGQGAAILLSGLMFGLYHGNLGQFVYAFVLGMFWAFIYLKTGKIQYTIILHMFVNFMGSIVGTQALKLLRMEEYLEAASSGDPTMIMAAVAQNASGWILFILYMLVVLAIVITGIVLFCVYGKKLKPEKSEISIPKGKRFTTIFLNVGVILYCVMWIGVIIWHL